MEVTNLFAKRRMLIGVVLSLTVGIALCLVPPPATMLSRSSFDWSNPEA